jgi:hypothetical protein
MSRLDEFETKLEALMHEFADISYDDMADALEYQALRTRNMHNRRD